MRQRIKDMANGNFEYENPAVSFSTEKLELVLPSEGSHIISFWVYSKNEIPIKGFAYSSLSRMECLSRNELFGEEAEVFFRFHSESLEEEAERQGEFCLILNGGEYHLPFTVKLSKDYPQSSIGVIRNFFDFANLAHLHWDEACQVFLSPLFEHVMKAGHTWEKLLYQALGGAKADPQNVREFLIGIKKALPENPGAMQASDVKKPEMIRTRPAILTQSYLSYRLGHMTKHHWMLEGKRLLSLLQETEGEDSWQYRYWTACIQNDFSKLKEIRETVRASYLLERENLYLFLIMLQADVELNQNKARKYVFMEEQFKRDTNSPLLYLAACELITEDSSLLKKAGLFERRILRWAVRKEVLNGEMALQAQNIVSRITQPHPAWLEILTACYELHRDRGALEALCGYCLSHRLYGGKYFHWYDLGVQEGLNPVGLYEAWLFSAEEEGFAHIPRAVALYFQYQTDVSDRYKALLYAGILKNKALYRSLQAEYWKIMDHFAYEQMMAGNVDENLAHIYEDFLSREEITPEIARALAPMLAVHKIGIADAKGACIVARYEQLKEELRVPIRDQAAYLPLYGDRYCLLLEDETGQRYGALTEWEIKPLFQAKSYRKTCFAYVQDDVSLLLSYFEGKRTWHSLLPEDMEPLQALRDSAAISEGYQRELCVRTIEYYYHSYTGTVLDEYLQAVDYEGLERKSREQLMELMIRRGIYGKAYEMISRFGDEHVNLGELLTLANREIGEREDEEAEDGELLAFCHDIFRRGKYSETLLQYLSRYFTGPAEELELLWRAAKDFGMDTGELEERFLMQLLYTESSDLEQIREVCQSYAVQYGRSRTVEAALAYLKQKMVG